EIVDFLRRHDVGYETVSDEDLFGRVAAELASGKVIGWFQGRTEFGPRALGARSIIGDARNAKMQSLMNLKIKFRESFRPFAPSVLRERVSEYFEIDADSPYMLLVAPVVKSRRLPMPQEAGELWGVWPVVVRNPSLRLWAIVAALIASTAGLLVPSALRLPYR